MRTKHVFLFLLALFARQTGALLAQELKKEVTIEVAGTLREAVGDQAQNITDLKVNGPMDERDLGILKKMANPNYQGKLANLDIQNTTITDDSQTNKNCLKARLFSSSTLKSIKLPTTLDEVKGFCFTNSKGLTDVYIGEKLSTLGGGAFAGCPDVKLHIDKKNPNFNTDGSGLYSKNSTTLIMYPLGKAAETYTLLDGCEVIARSAFLADANGVLRQIVFPASMRTVQQDAFTLVPKVEKVTLNEGLETIGIGAFRGLALSTITLPKSLKEIGGQAFMQNPKLKNISFAAGFAPEKCGGNIFHDCPVQQVTIPGTMKIIPDGFLSHCKELKSVTIEEGVSKIFDAAFAESGVEQINFPSSIQYITDNAFFQCLGLTEIEFGRELLEVGLQAFYGCTGIKKITCHKPAPPVLGENALGGLTNELVEIHVPKKAIELYKAATGWSAFSKYIALPDDLPDAYIAFKTGLPKGSTIKITVLSEPNFSVDWGDGKPVVVESQYFTDVVGQIQGETIRLLGEGIQGITCVGVKMQEIDVAHCPALAILSVSENELGKLDVSNNPALEVLTCARNKLTELNVSANSRLRELVFFENKIKGIDLSNNPAMEKLIVDDNRLTELNISRNPAIVQLGCSGNNLHRLELSQNPEIELLAINDIGLERIDLKAQNNLVSILANGNRLSTINLSNMPNLKKVAVRGNLLQALDVSQNPLIRVIECDSNRITTLDLSKSKDLMRLTCMDNLIRTIDFSAAKARMMEIVLSGNPLAALPSFKDYKMLEVLHVARTGAKALELGANPKLFNINVSGNALSAETLNAIYKALPDLTKAEPPHPSMAPIFGKCAIYHNPGTDTSDSSIAKKKAWTVVSVDPLGLQPIGCGEDIFACRYDGATHRLVFASAIDVVEVSLYDLSGRLVFKTNDPTRSMLLTEGVYIVRVKLSNGSVRTAKITI